MTSVEDVQNASRERLRAATEGLARAENELRDAIAEAIGNKLTKDEIARTTRVSRTTIYAWTKPKESHRA